MKEQDDAIRMEIARSHFSGDGKWLELLPSMDSDDIEEDQEETVDEEPATVTENLCIDENDPKTAAERCLAKVRSEWCADEKKAIAARLEKYKEQAKKDVIEQAKKDIMEKNAEQKKIALQKEQDYAAQRAVTGRAQQIYDSRPSLSPTFTPKSSGVKTRQIGSGKTVLDIEMSPALSVLPVVDTGCLLFSKVSPERSADVEKVYGARDQKHRIVKLTRDKRHEEASSSTSCDDRARKGPSLKQVESQLKMDREKYATLDRTTLRAKAPTTTSWRRRDTLAGTATDTATAKLVKVCYQLPLLPKDKESNDVTKKVQHDLTEPPKRERSEAVEKVYDARDQKQIGGLVREFHEKEPTYSLRPNTAVPRATTANKSQQRGTTRAGRLSPVFSRTKETIGSQKPFVNVRKTSAFQNQPDDTSQPGPARMLQAPVVSPPGSPPHFDSALESVNALCGNGGTEHQRLAIAKRIHALQTKAYNQKLTANDPKPLSTGGRVDMLEDRLQALERFVYNHDMFGKK